MYDEKGKILTKDIGYVTFFMLLSGQGPILTR